MWGKESGPPSLHPPGPVLLLGSGGAVPRQSHGELRRDRSWILHFCQGTSPRTLDLGVLAGLSQPLRPKPITVGTLSASPAFSLPTHLA